MGMWDNIKSSYAGFVGWVGGDQAKQTTEQAFDAYGKGEYAEGAALAAQSNLEALAGSAKNPALNPLEAARNISDKAFDYASGTLSSPQTPAPKAGTAAKSNSL